MIETSHTAPLVALLRRAHPRAVMDLLEERGTPRAALEHLVLGSQLQLGRDADAELLEALIDAEREIDEWVLEGIRVVTVLDEEYPLNLRTVHDKPPLLTIRGSMSHTDHRSVAVVGTRRASDRGIREATQISQNLVEAGYVVVSGLAAGIDAASHRATLAAGGRTIGVIGTGLHHAYPKQNAALQRQLETETAVVSQFWPEQGPRKYTFPMRNAVMSGIARATVVVEASFTSGARIQARHALAHGRPVVLLRSLVEEHDWAREHVGRPGVYVVDRVSEVVERLDDLYAPKLALAI